MVDYIYEGSYSCDDIFTSNSYTISSRPMLHVLVFGLAEYCGISSLKRSACAQFKSVAASEWSKQEFGEAIRYAYEKIPDQDTSLREEMLDVAARHTHDLFLDNNEFKLVLSTSPAFGFDLTKAMSNISIEDETLPRTSDDMKHYRCDTC